MKSERCAHQSTIIGDKIYLVGGCNGTQLADTEIIPISKNDKTLMPRIPTMHNRRMVFGMCSFAGCIFVAGGYSNDKELAKCEVYSTESCEWTKVSSMNTQRRSFALIYFQNKVWAIGGFSNNNYVDTIEKYDLAENKWTTLDVELLSKRRGHSAVVHNKKFFVIGGFNQVFLSSIEVYSSETDQFSFVSPMLHARASFGCSIFNNNLIVFGGDLNEIETTDCVQVYDIEKQAWSKGTNLPLPLTGFGYASNN